MVIGLAIGLIVVVVTCIVALVAFDVRTRPRAEWHTALKEWQSLTGAVLGLLGAAGVFVLGTEIQAEQTRQRAVDVQHAIGRGLALEVERLAQGLRAGQVMAESLTFNGSEEDARKCALYMSELQRYLPPETPVYSAVLADMTEFGDQNLTWFVRFHGVYADILRALAQSHQNACTALTGKADVGYVASLIGGALGFYDEIATRYDIVPIATTEAIEQRMEAVPAVPAPPATEPATAN